MIVELHILHPETAVPQQLALPVDETITLGSGASSGIQLAHPFVDDSHAQLTVSADGATLIDLESVNGTAVNGHRIPPQQHIPLHDGDIIEIGWFELRVLFALEAHDAPAAAESDAPSVVDEGEKSPPEPAKTLMERPLPANGRLPFEFEKNFSHYIQYLPGIYDVPFMHRFLALFESILEPVVWRIDSRDLLLDGQTTPADFLDWLGHWHALTFDHTWSEAKKRHLLRLAPTLFGCWGTAKALQTVLDIYVEQPVTIVDDETMPAFTFRVELPQAYDEEQYQRVARLINSHKPAYTSFELHFTGASQ